MTTDLTNQSLQSLRSSVLSSRVVPGLNPSVILKGYSEHRAISSPASYFFSCVFRGVSACFAACTPCSKRSTAGSCLGCSHGAGERISVSAAFA